MKSKDNKVEIEQISDIVGEWGRWQFVLAIYCFLLWGVSAFVNMGYSFHAKTVNHWCSDVPENYPNITEDMECHKYVNPNESCSEWHYNTTEYKKSIVTEFDLVCDRAKYASLTQSFFMLGYVVSGLITSYYSDKYGRKPMALMSYCVEVIGIISCGLSVNIFQYSFSRVLVGFGHSGGGWAIYTILLEICGPKHRSDIVYLTGVGWVTGYALLPGFAYWLQDFRYLQLISVIPMILMLIWFFYLYESPRWQITKGQLDKAEITLRQALKMNGKSDENLREKINHLSKHILKNTKLSEEKKTYNLLDLLKTPNLRKYTLIMWYSWIVNALIYYGFSFNMSDFGGNFYITFLLSGLVELPTQLFPPLMLRFIGRRTMYSIFMAILAVSSFAVIPAKSEWLKVFFALVGKLAVSTSWGVHSLHGTEIYPTVIRNTGMGVQSVVGRIGSMTAPFMGNLAKTQGLTFVMIVYGTLSAIGAILGLYLPETKGKEIPNTVEEAENLENIEMKRIETNAN